MLSSKFNEKYGNYIISEKYGVVRIKEVNGETSSPEYISSTPLIVSAIYMDTATGNISIELSWYLKRTDEIKTEIFEKKTLMSRSGLKELYDGSFDISDVNVSKLAQYFSDMFKYSLVNDDIPFKFTTQTLGWHELDGELEFTPYSEKLILKVNDRAYIDLCNSINVSGDAKKWCQRIASIKLGDCTPAKIAIAASFASCMMRFIGVDPFVVNLYGKTGIGKTLLLNIAASLWGSPNLIQNNNASSTAIEAKLKFLNSFPFLLDEIKGSDSTNKDLNSLAYIFSGGKGKARGSATGGLLAPPEGWKNIMISTGEQPYIGNDANNGVVNRVLDIYCGENSLFSDPRDTYDFFQNNYGFLKRFFIHMKKQGLEKIFDGYEIKFKEICEYYCSLGISEKQASLGATLVVSDMIFSENILTNIKFALTKEELLPYLRSEKSIDNFREALSSLYDYIQMNKANFVTEENSNPPKFWGFIEKDKKYVVGKVVADFLELKGVDKNQFNRYLKNNGLIEIGRDGKSTIPKTVNGLSAMRYYCFKVPEVLAFLNE